MFSVIVTKVRSFNYASVFVLNSSGSTIPQSKPTSVKFPSWLTDCVNEGSVWDVDGVWHERTYTIQTGKQITERCCKLSKAEQINPEGQALAIWIEKNIPGIGSATANKLVRGIKNLNKVVLDGDVDTLLKIDGMTEKKVNELILNWLQPDVFAAIKFLSSCNISPKLAEPITQIYGGSAEEVIREDPYTLVPLGVPFQDVESLISKLSIKVTEASRESALAEDIVHSISLKGSTVVSLEQIKSRAQCLGYEVSDDIANHAVSYGTLVSVKNGFQTVGMARLEAFVGHSISEWLDREKGQGALFAAWERDLSLDAVSSLLIEYETNELGFTLTEEQKSAVVESVLNPVSCISGGAGVGKTTILKAILGVYELLNPVGLDIKLMALSGRAARRMTESTGYEAITIAKFVYDELRRKKSVDNRHDQMLVIIDEASMVDLHTMYKLVRLLPVATRMIFVGDVAQLPPVGGGLIFHELVETRIPTLRLTEVKRQEESSGIHQLATQIRIGNSLDAVCSLYGYEDIQYLPRADLSLVEEVWRNEGGAENAIILAPTNVGSMGVDAINTYIQNRIGIDRPRLHYVDDRGDKLPWRIKGRYLHLNDQVMVTENDYRNHIRNGDLATIVEVYEDCDEGVYGILELDGIQIEIKDEVISKLDLGYAVTIHKSQGSQWSSVIVLLTDEGKHMTDRSLLYTAATRPENKLVLIGNKSLLVSAIDTGNFADIRTVGLCELVGKGREIGDAA